MGIGVFELLILAVILVSPIVLGVATTYIVVRWSRKPWLWALTPLFVLLWLGCGAVPLAGFGVTTRTVAVPRPQTPSPPAVETEESSEGDGAEGSAPEAP